MLALPGFIEAHAFDAEQQGEGFMVHTVHYVLADQAALDYYLEHDAPTMRAKGQALFGDDIETSRSVRQVTSKTEQRESSCLNCDATLSGQYCWNCGQRGNIRLISLMELVRDAFGDMFELDSRLWRTLIPLAVRPGHLTRDYLRGRRARYMPPFRMYLVLSFVFFLITRLTGQDYGIFQDSANDAEPTINAELTVGDDVILTTDPTAKDLLTDTISDQPGDLMEPGEQTPTGAGDEVITDQQNVLTNADPPAHDNRIDTGQDPELLSESSSDLSDDTASADATSEASEDGDGFYCTVDFTSLGMPWIDEQISEERISEVCKDIQEDRGKRFIERVVQSFPVAALMLLPLLAFLLKLLYPLSRRYYVEHLLLLVHYHAFLFLAMSVTYLYNEYLSRVISADIAFIIPNILIGIYMPFYLYKSMRRVYGQGRILSILKYLALLFGYVLAIAIVAIINVLWVFVTY